MPNQGSTTLEVLLGQLAHNQNDETMYKVYADLASLTTANLKRVLGSLLDPVSFYSQYVLTREAFAEGLKKAYQRVQKDGVSRQLNALRGAIGLVCFMLELLSKAESQEHTSSTTLKWPQELLRDSAVRDQFYEVYKPTKRQDEDTDQKKNFEQAQKHWRELELDSLELYQIGTTSFILRCKLRDRKGEHLVLKCLLFPYTKVAFISDATRKYAIDYSGDNVPTTAKVHSSTDKWILMNFIDGRTLQELLDDRRNAEDKAKALPLLRTDLLASIGKMLLEALNKLSDANIQHEDLTPSNIYC